MKTDIEIAQSATLEKINNIATFMKKILESNI